MKKTNIQTLKGFRDFLPEEMLERQWLLKKITSVFEAWGYDPLETPTLEALELFTGQIGEEEKLFFKFFDQGNRQVALRYDQTVPVCRVMAQYSQQLPMPFRRYQIQPAFRAEKPQKGRYREFLQCDADIFGETSPLADAEVIGLGLEIYKQLGFKQVIVLINDRVLLKNIPYKAVVAIDKLEKIGRQGVLKDMVKKGISLKKAKEYLNFVAKLKPNERIKTIFNYLKNLGFADSWYKFDPTIARSFAYSDGPIWEIKIPGFNSGSVLGGERFDGLTKAISGTNIPGTGFGLGFDRTLEAAKQFGLVPKTKTKTQVLITQMDKKYLKSSLATAQTLRAKNIKAEVYPTIKKITKQLKYADKKGIPWAIILGENEINQNKITLKNMITGKQNLLNLNEIIKVIKNTKK